jgi:hypothetical protein
MMARRTAILAMAVAALGATLTAPAGASTSGSSSALETATFTDPAGDAQGGPDITRVAVSGDAATGLLTLTVTAPGYAAAVSGGLERDISVWLDTDRSSSTGDPDDGSEYGLMAWNDASGRWWNIVRWDGAAWKSVPESATMRVSGQGESVTWALSTADLGGATSFRFYAVAGNWNTTSGRYDTRDDAPDTGWWDFDISASSAPTTPTTPAAPKVGLLVGAPSSTPKAPVAGRTFTVTFPVRVQTQKTITSIDLQTGDSRESLVVTWQPASGGTMTCSASAGRKVPIRCGAFKGDSARVSLVVPKTAAGKTLKITVKFTAKDKATGKSLSSSRTVSFRVK